MTTTYVPPGYVGLIEAILLIAMRRNPERWEPSQMAPGEEALWHGFLSLSKVEWQEDRIAHRGEILGDYLTYNIPTDIRASNGGVIQRYADYRDAEAELRIFLAEGIVTAYFVDDGGALDHIRKEGWRTSAGQEILWRGAALLDEGRTVAKPRFILVRKADVVNVLTNRGGKNLAQTASTNPSQVRLSADTHPAPKNPGRGKKTVAVHLAVQARWPKGIPPGLAVKDRDNEIIKWTRENGHSQPDPRTIRRYFNSIG